MKISKTRFLNWAVLALLLSESDVTRCAQVVSSPEGTATKYVSEHGPVVYAPRAARAQKVIFDTPDKQLIWTPDTPFRNFFDSHSADFEPGTLEYAKSTILSDIIAMLRSREYLRYLVAAVIDEHKKTAISDLDPAQQVLKALPQEIQAVVVAITNKVSVASSERAEGQPEGLNLLRNEPAVTNSFTILKQSVDAFSQVIVKYPSSSAMQDAMSHLRDLTNQIQQLVFAGGTGVEALTNSSSAAVKSVTSAVKEQPHKSDEWRNNHAQLLTDALCLHLIRQNYPDMDDDRIEALIADFTAVTNKLLQTGGEVTSTVWAFATAQDVAQNLEAGNALALELTQRLKGRDWLRIVLDRAIANRSDLFKRTGSPVQGLRDTEDAFRKWAEAKLFNPALAGCLKSDSVSLWQAFLNHLNTGLGNGTNRFLLQPSGNRERRMDSDELRLFGSDFRQELLTKGKGPDGSLGFAQLDTTISNYFAISDKGSYLCPEYGTGLSIQKLEETAEGFWSNHLRSDRALNAAWSVLTNAMADTNGVKGELTNFLVQVVQSVQAANLQQSRDDRIESSELFRYVTNHMATALAQNGKGEKNLDSLISSSLPKPIPLNAARARQRLITDLHTVFTGSLPVIRSDDSLVKAFLSSDQANYALPEFRTKALRTVPNLFYARNGTNETATNAVTVFKQVVEDPEIAYLFGSGNGNPQVIEAFKQEFCSAFKEKDKLQSAMEAEHEADYDYWWLTFYPKAIPLGNKRLQGASIIEIGFPETVIPEIQYHRWLQDTSLTGDGNQYNKSKLPAVSPKLESNSPTSPTSGRLIRNLRLRNATTLLRDMLDVLELVDLKSKFTEVRPMMLHGLEEFTKAENTDEVNYRSGVRALYEEVFPEDRAWLKALAEVTDKFGIDENGKVRLKVKDSRDFSLDLSVIVQQTNSVDEILKKINFQVPATRWGDLGDLGTKILERLALTPSVGSKKNLPKSLDDVRGAMIAKIEALESDFQRNVESRLEEMQQSVIARKRHTSSEETYPKVDQRQLKVAIANDFAKTLRTLEALDFSSPTVSKSDALNLIRKSLDDLQTSCGATLARFLMAQDSNTVNLSYIVKRTQRTLQNSLADRLAGCSSGLEGANQVETDDEEPTEYEKGIQEAVRSFAINFYLRQQDDNEVRSKVRDLLRNLELDKHHILFSVYALSGTKARLPEKVNLYLWAQAQGVMFFLNKDADLTNKSTQEHLVDYYNNSEPLRSDHIETLRDISKNHLESMRAEAELYRLILNSYFSSYPDVPTKQNIQESYFIEHREHLLSVVYDWLDYSCVLFNPENPTLLMQFVHDSRFLSDNGRFLLRALLEKYLPKKEDKTDYRDCLSNAVHELFNDSKNLPLANELSDKLLGEHYKSLWEMLAMIEETERHAVPYEQITLRDYSTFRFWGRPKFQRGIQIVEMLPESRDDLVSMSINEGGVVAQLAGEADGSAAYDLNEAKMAQRYANIIGTQLGKSLSGRQQDLTNGLGTLKQSLEETASDRRQQTVRDLSQLNQSLSSQGYSLGATANGSVYARAKAALAYSRRREYLDAAITSAGRGDNYAKWVVRTSDLRSDLAKGQGKKLVAASHNGFPNGDQPFYLLIKIPHRSVKQDWYGRKYIYFNSTYIATSRESAWKQAGFPGLLVKAPLALINPHWWTEIEEGLVGTQFPFMWDVRSQSQQADLLHTPNVLGGAIWLDDTDKVRYSEIQDQLSAEDNFIRLTREAQSRDLGNVMNDIQKESGQFNDQVRKQMSDRVKSMQKAYTEAEQATGISNRLNQIESELNALKQRYNGTNGASQGK
jgi:hypothetical protein